DSQIGRQRFISLLFLLRARRVTGGKTTSTIRISPLLPQSGPNACAQRNETGSPETTSKTLSIATSHQPSLPRPHSPHPARPGCRSRPGPLPTRRRRSKHRVQGSTAPVSLLRTERRREDRHFPQGEPRP